MKKNIHVRSSNITDVLFNWKFSPTFCDLMVQTVSSNYCAVLQDHQQCKMSIFMNGLWFLKSRETFVHRIFFVLFARVK